MKKSLTVKKNFMKHYTKTLLREFKWKKKSVRVCNKWLWMTSLYRQLVDFDRKRVHLEHSPDQFWIVWRSTLSLLNPSWRCSWWTSQSNTRYFERMWWRMDEHWYRVLESRYYLDKKESTNYMHEKRIVFFFR